MAARFQKLSRNTGLASLCLALLILATATSSGASLGECQPCVGISLSDSFEVTTVLAAGPALGEDDVVYLRAAVDLAADPAAIDWQPAAAAGARPWVAVTLATPSPLRQNLDALSSELEKLARLAAESPARSTFELVWRPGGESGATTTGSSEATFLIKRAAVAISGAQPEARVLFRLEALAPDRSAGDFLDALYEDDVAAYLDGLVVDASSAGFLDESSLVDLVVGDLSLPDLRSRLDVLDPGSDLALVDVAIPGEAPSLLSSAARAAEAGASIVVFRSGPQPASALLPYLNLISHELSGDVAFDPYASASGAETWAFVHGSDLSLRVFVKRPEGFGGGRLALDFSTSQLSSPAIFDPLTGEASALYSGQRTRRGYRIEIDNPPAAFLLRLERPGMESLSGVEGVEEQVLVADVRQMPVSEILRRLQAFEDAQSRRIDNYIAINATSLRFQLGGVQSIDATYRGPYFFRRDQPTDWVWQEFLINGVRWRGKKVPEIPLLQPEKASALPLAITFSRDYQYRLRGTAIAEGRDCWVIDFEPAVRPEPGRSLFQGTVWVDRELYARVRTRALQLGLEGEVQSNEETMVYSPIDEQGAPAPWTAESYFLPLRLNGQQQLSLLGSTTLLEREVVLSEVEINTSDFDARREVQLASSATMLRDTDEGLRYLVADEETGERVVQNEVDPTRLFLAGGVFYDESLDFPLPLAGVNWFSYDFRGTGTQINAFFAGPFLTVDVASPSLFGSKFTGGVDFAALAIAGTDTTFRGDREAIEEDVKTLRPNLELTVGRPLGNYFTLDLQYNLGWSSFRRSKETAADFVLPQDHLRHSLGLIARYDRRGYRLRINGSQSLRGSWEPWGLPGAGLESEFEPTQDTYSRWGGSLSKVWHLPLFQKIGAQVEYVGGQDLDRFSKYEFGFFSGIRVHGYRSDRVRAEEAYATHLSYGFGIGEVFRIDLVGDAAWATDQAAGFDNELLGGVGLVGTFTGPWSTVWNVDVGVPVAGPDNGFSAFIAILKLFR